MTVGGPAYRYATATGNKTLTVYYIILYAWPGSFYSATTIQTIRLRLVVPSALGLLQACPCTDVVNPPGFGSSLSDKHIFILLKCPK